MQLVQNLSIFFSSLECFPSCTNVPTVQILRHTSRVTRHALSNIYFLLIDWVVKLGPPTFGDHGMYQYSVVTDNLQATLFVLARDVDTFRSQFDEEVTSWLAENGFTHFWNKPVPTVQNTKCLYVAKRASLCQTPGEFLRYE